MIFEAEVWYWTPQGMQRGRPPTWTVTEGYITRRQAEELCEQAHRNGFRAGRDENQRFDR